MKRVFCILLVAAVLLASLPAGAGAAAVKFKDNVTLYSSPLELYHALTAVNGVVGGME